MAKVEFNSNVYYGLKDFLEYAAQLEEEGYITSEDAALPDDTRAKRCDALVKVRNCVLCVIEKFYLNPDGDIGDATEMAGLYYNYQFDQEKYHENRAKRIANSGLMPDPSELLEPFEPPFD